MDDFGAISLVPTLIVFVLAILTRRPIESLLAGSLVALGMINGMQFVAGFAEASIRVMTDEDVAWVILVCGFMGGCVACSCCYLRIHPVAGQHETCRVARTNHRPDRAAWCPAYRTGKQYDRTEKRCQATNFNVYPADDRAGGGDAVRQHVWQPRLFYADATVLTAQATGCTPMQHALTQISYALIAASISLLGYLLIAFG